MDHCRLVLMTQKVILSFNLSLLLGGFLIYFRFVGRQANIWFILNVVYRRIRSLLVNAEYTDTVLFRVFYLDSFDGDWSFVYFK